MCARGVVGFKGLGGLEWAWRDERGWQGSAGAHLPLCGHAGLGLEHVPQPLQQAAQLLPHLWGRERPGGAVGEGGSSQGEDAWSTSAMSKRFTCGGGSGQGEGWVRVRERGGGGGG